MGLNSGVYMFPISVLMGTKSLLFLKAIKVIAIQPVRITDAGGEFYCVIA